MKPRNLAPVKLFSFPRSGVTAVAGFVATNLWGRKYNHDAKRYRTGHWSQRTRAARSEGVFAVGAQLFGDHYPYDREFMLRGSGNEYRRGTKAVSPAGKKVYVVRDGRDVACSLWRTKRLINKEWADDMLGGFLRRKLDFNGSPSFRLRFPTSTIAEAWADHVNGWLDAPTLLIVRYEDFVRRPLETLAYVAGFLELPMPDCKYLPSHLVGVAPHEGGIGAHRVLMTEAQNEQFLSQVTGRAKEFLELP